jgi:hypothetical protein
MAARSHDRKSRIPQQPRTAAESNVQPPLAVTHRRVRPARPTSKQTTSIEVTAEDDFECITTRLDRIHAYLQREAPWSEQEILPSVDVVQRVARLEYETLSDAGAKAHQQLLRNVLTVLIQRYMPKARQAEALEAAFEVIQGTLDATEDLALRAGFFVGLTHGMCHMAVLTDAATGDHS